MQIASMFASLGFKVDTSGLDKFKQSLASARHEFTNLNQGVKQSSRHLRSLKSALDSVDTALNKVRGAGANNKIITSYRDMATAVEKVNTHLQNITTHQPNTTKAIGKINSSVHAGVQHWKDYADAVNRARDALRQVRTRVLDLQRNGNISINVRQSGNLNGRGGSSGSGNTSEGGFGMPLILGSRGGISQFFRSFLPTVALAGGLTSAGYLTKEGIQRGREQTKMENVLLFSSKNLDEFNNALIYVKNTANELGVSSKELGTAFAQINMSAGNALSFDSKKSMFKDMSAVFATMGANKEEQFLLFKSVNQMFSLGRIQAEEMNQLTGQGLVPRQAVYQAIRDTYGKNLSSQDIAKLQKANKLDPSLIVPKLFKSLYEQADKSGALDKYKNSSQFRQGQLLESLDQLSKELMDSGLDSFLAVIFHLLDGIVKSLTQLVKELKPTVAAIKEISSTMSSWYKSLNDVTGGNNILIGVLLILLGRFRHIGRVGSIVVTMLQSGTRWSRIFSTVLTGTFGAGLGKIIGKFTVWGLLIWGVSKALSFVYNQMERSKAGQWTFFDELFARTEITALEIERLLLQIDLFKAKIGLKGNGISFDLGAKAGDWARQQYRSFVGLPNDSPKPYVAPKKDTAFVPYRQSSLMNSTIPNFKSSTTVPAVVNIGQVVVDKNGMAVASKATTTIPNMISP